MTKEIELFDALCGTGKTTAIFQYMAKHQEKKWIYLSPMKTEIETRVPAEADANGINFFIAVDKGKRSEYKTKTQQVLAAMKEGQNIACTHALMMLFQQEHIELLKEHQYHVVCDEELDLIEGFSLRQGDTKFLLENNRISISPDNGRVSFLSEMDIDTRYGDIKSYADMGCLYAARTRTDFLVLQISPRVVEAAERFILLTYNYKGSIMDTFMQMHGFSCKYLEDIKPYKDNKEVINKLRDLIVFVETPSVKKWQKKTNVLSATWWRKTSTEEDFNDLRKAVRSVVSAQKGNSTNVMLTVPKHSITGYDSDGESSKRVRKFTVDKLIIDDAYVQMNARATNDYAHKSIAIHLCNIYPSQPVKVYMQDMGFVCDNDTFALNTLIQWLFRSCIRNDETVKVALFSGRMSVLLKEWLITGVTK